MNVADIFFWFMVINENLAWKQIALHWSQLMCTS